MGNRVGRTRISSASAGGYHMGPSSRFLGNGSGRLPRCSVTRRATINLISLTLVFGLGCKVVSPTPPAPLPPILPLPAPQDDAGTPVDICEASCRNMRVVNSQTPCPGFTGGSTRKGVLCEDVCRQQTPDFDLHPDCTARATSCDAMRACFR